MLSLLLSLVSGWRQVYHPNIDLDGNVCLNILREDWKPVLSLSAIVYGLQFLLLEPNAEDPLNKGISLDIADDANFRAHVEAAHELRTSPRLFESNAYRAMRGQTLNGVRYDDVLSSMRF